MKKKKIAAVVTSIALIAVVGIGATLAYFTDKDTKQNIITLGKVDGSLIEDSKDGTPTDDGYKYDKVKPGDKLDKKPHVELDSKSEDAYTRMKVTVTIDNMKDASLASTYAAVLEEKLDISADWTKNKEDGYYYYAGKLSNADGGITKTSDIFTTVTIPEEWGNEISEATITIDLQAELIQADNFDSKITVENGKVVKWNISADDIKAYTE